MKVKKINSRGFSHLEVLLIALVLVVIVGVGIIVLENNKSSSNTAHAGSWTPISVNGSFVYKGGTIKPTVAVCATMASLPPPPGDGGTTKWQIGVLADLGTAVAPNGSGVFGTATISYKAGNGTTQTVPLGSSAEWWDGLTQEFESTMWIAPQKADRINVKYVIGGSSSGEAVGQGSLGGAPSCS